jgi:hypothetical protein
MLGAKTVTSVLLLVLASALGWYVGMSPARLATLGPMEAFWGALFAFLTGSLVYRYWRLHLPSAHYFRWCADEVAWSDEAHFLGSAQKRILIGDNLGDAFDFGPKVQYAIYVALTFWLALITLDSRAFELLAEIPAQLEERGSEYCPEQEVVKQEVKLDPGCALIRRAFELGYAKSLGPCGAQTEEEKKLELCTLRQHDEPFLHYAWRRLDDFAEAATSEASAMRTAELQKAFLKRAEHIEDLYDASRFTVEGSPRASHHVFTNLPRPSGWLDGALYDQSCAERYRRLPHRLPSGELRSSRLFEHILAQLLFDTSYARAAGACREYTIHWGAPTDACVRLEKDPEGLLSEHGALGEVKEVLNRYRVTTRLQNVAEGAEGMSSLGSLLLSVPPQRFVSFHCWIEEERADVAAQSRALTLDEYGFSAREVRVPVFVSGIGTDRYHQVAAMLVPSFHYGNLLSDASTSELLESGVDAKFFSGKSGFLSRLDYLADVDILLGNEWIEERDDLLDVYPWHVHLQNYVQLFRSRYRSSRGRL